MATDKEVEDLKRQVKELKGSLGDKTPKENIYSPEAQVPLSEYKGTREEYKEEARLRRIASGKRDTFTSQTLRFVTAAVFGNKKITDAVRGRFQERYSKEEVEEAQKQLEKEFGIKKKIKEDKLVTRKFKKVLKNELSPINNSIVGIQSAVKSVGEDVKRAERAIKSIDKFLVKSIADVITTFASGRRGELDSTPDRMKPSTIADAEGREYLYYPDAPPGRQLYEKSKTGTAGRIASREVQESLESKLKQLDQDSRTRPIRVRSDEDATSAIVSQIKVLLEEESMFRKRDMEKLIGELKESLIAKKKSSIFDAEPDEQEKMMADAMEKALDKTLYNALKEVFERNPNLLNSNGIGGLIVPGFFKGLTNFLRKLPLGKLLKGGGYIGLATYAATELVAPLVASQVQQITDTRADVALKKNLETLDPSSIASTIAPDQESKIRAYRLQQYRKIAADNPELKVKLDQAEKIAGTVGLTPVQVRDNIKPTTATNTGMAESKSQLTLAQPSPTVGQQIIDQNQKRIEIDNAEKVEIPAQTVTNVTNNSVIPVPSGKKNIEVHNSENTFNRLLAQEFDHPATYASMNMG